MISIKMRLLFLLVLLPFLLPTELFAQATIKAENSCQTYGNDYEPSITVATGDFYGTFKVYGNAYGGQMICICPTEGPYDMSYAFEAYEMEYRVLGTNLSGNIFPERSGAPGQNGICGASEGWRYSYEASINTSNLSPGTYTVEVTFRNTNNQSVTDTAPFTVGTPVAPATVNVSSNRATTWIISGPQNFSNSPTAGTYASYSGPAGNYGIAADSIACYNRAITPSEDQSVSSGGSITFNINYTDNGSCGGLPPPPPPPPPPGSIYADIKATPPGGSASDGPISVDYNSSATISWTSIEATSCTVTPGNWTGTSGSQSSGALTSSINYVLNCNGPAGNATDSVTINVNGQPPPPPCEVNNAANYISQSVPTEAYVGQTFGVTITMQNVGCSTWTMPGPGHIHVSEGFKLGSQNWQDNDRWGTARVGVPFNVPPGEPASFSFNVVAPSTVGVYNFQWRMVEEYVQWFGGFTPNVQINVIAENPPVGSHDAANCSIIGGWAFDPDTSGSGIAIHLYKDGPAGSSSGTLFDDTTTVGLRSDVNSIYGITGNHGWTITTPTSLKDNIPHLIYAYGINSNPNGSHTLLTGSPMTINCPDETPRTLSVSITSGSGTVTSSPAGISCPGDCSESFPNGTVVTLNPTESSGYSWGSWSGSCTGASRPCYVSMDADKSVGASFTASPPFVYSLSNSGTSNVVKNSGNAYTTNTITKTRSSGTAQPVTLTLSGVPSGVSYSLDGNSTCAPSPTCATTITFTVASSAPVGNHNILVTGQPNGVTTSFTLAITGSPITVSCSASPTTALVGQNVSWSASASGGNGPYTYTWSGTNIPTLPAPTGTPYNKTYTTVGTKTATVTVRDSNNVQGSCPVTTVRINFNPDFEEF